MAINSRDKGKRGELMWKNVCIDHGHTKARRMAQYCGKTGDAADCVGLPGMHQEVKFVDKLNLSVAMEQAIRDSKAAGKGHIPMVAHKRTRGPWMVTMLSDDWFPLYEAWRAAQGLPMDEED